MVGTDVPHPEVAQHVPAGTVRKVDVQQQQVWTMGDYGRDCRLSGVGLAHNHPTAAQVPRDHSSKRRLVLDDENVPVRSWSLGGESIHMARASRVRDANSGPIPVSTQTDQ